MKRLTQFKIIHLMALTALVAVGTTVVMSYLAKYGMNPVLEGSLGFTALACHGIYVAFLTAGTLGFNRIPRQFAIPAIAVELLGAFYTFGRFGLIGFLISMAGFILGSIVAGLIGYRFGPRTWTPRT